MRSSSPLTVSRPLMALAPHPHLLPARGEKGAFDVGAHSAEGVGLVSTVGAVAPLCPAGHLPLKGGDQAVDGFLPIATGLRSVQPARQPFSPLEGEMSDRTEGGVARAFQDRLLRSRAGFRRGLPSVRENGARFSCLSVGIEVARKARPAGRCPVCRPVTRAICALAAFPQPT